MTRCTFAKDEHTHQEAYFAENFTDFTGHLGRPFQLKPEFRLHGLLPIIRDEAERIFAKDCLGIQWHTYIGHGRSSQACCLNFLMPMASRPALLQEWISALLSEKVVEVMSIESPDASPHSFVAFEYTGPNGKDYLGEAGGKKPQRGANATASDAAVAFCDEDGRKTLVLIEWKYTEQYRNHRLSEDRQGKRYTRYGSKMFRPNGPIRADLGLKFEDFLHEPFYQLVRQQMLAQRIEADPDSGFDRVMVVHLSPRGNLALHHMTSAAIGQAFETVTGRATRDAFEAYQECLFEPDRFMQRYIEEAFAPLAASAKASEWYSELRNRYPSLCPA